MRGLSIDPRMQRLGFDLRGIPGLEAAWLSRFPYGLGTMRLPDDGAPMGTWTDLSGKGRDLTQATSANQPLWKANSGIPGMQFDGANDFLQTVPLAGWPETTVYAVATVLATDLRRGLVAHIQNPAGPNGWNLYSADSNQAGKPAFVSYTGGSFVSKAGTAELTPVPALLTAQVGQATQLWQNGNAASSQTSGAFTPVTSEIIEVGRYRGQAFSSGLIHDVIICSQAHDDATRKRVEAALARANGVTLAA